ncbi:MAG: MotA/TolQ/ExbB proton channel family protein [Planctomycetota bacterium]
MTPNNALDLVTLAQDAPAGKSLFEHIASGGPIGLLIIMLSFAAVALVIVHLVQLRLQRLAPVEHFEKLGSLLSARKIDSARSYCLETEPHSFLLDVVGAALTRCARSPFGLLEFRASLEEAGQQEVSKLNRSIEGLALIASVAPMLGLLGTVVGMVGAFDRLGASAGGFARPDELASSISVALITTVLGLVVAIPVTACTTFFRNRIDALAAAVAEMTEELLGYVESHQAPSQAPHAATPQQAAASGARAASPPPSGAQAQGAPG